MPAWSGDLGARSASLPQHVFQKCAIFRISYHNTVIWDFKGSTPLTPPLMRSLQSNISRCRYLTPSQYLLWWSITVLRYKVELLAAKKTRHRGGLFAHYLHIICTGLHWSVVTQITLATPNLDISRNSSKLFVKNDWVHCMLLYIWHFHIGFKYLTCTWDPRLIMFL